MKRFCLLIIILLLCSCGNSKKNLDSYSIKSNDFNYEVTFYYDNDCDYKFEELEDKYSFQSDELNVKGNLWIYSSNSFDNNKTTRKDKKSFKEYKFNKEYDSYVYQQDINSLEINIKLGKDNKDIILYFFLEKGDSDKKIEIIDIMDDKDFKKMLNSIEVNTK